MFGYCALKDPEPPAAWVGVRDASKNAGSVCIQLESLPNPTIIGSEDCLYLSVFIPENIYGTKQNPVMFWVHGGGYYGGSGNDTHKRPDYLMAKDVILVSINYRLGALGEIYFYESIVFFKYFKKFYMLYSKNLYYICEKYLAYLCIEMHSTFIIRCLIYLKLSRFLKSWS